MCRSDKTKATSQRQDEPSSSEEKQSGKAHDALSLRDFFDPRNPWDLRDRVPHSEAIQNWFKFVPLRFKEGPWLPLATWSIVSTVGYVIYATIDANIEYYNDGSIGTDGIMEEFVGHKSYTAFTTEWYYNVVLFLWTSYVAWTIYDFHKAFTAWISYTMCSWTLLCVRHGLCAVAPFVPSVRVLAGALRFPLLLSASLTFGMWNFALMPVIALGFLEGERRRKFVRWAFNWKMCQIHVFNILWAYLNCVWAEPTAQPLHLGDVNAGVVYSLGYMAFYYFVLDRIGIPLYPIVSPRSYICIPSMLLQAGISVGNYKLWNHVLSADA